MIFWFSQNINQHFKHLNTLIKIIKKAGLVISAKKMVLFQTKIKFLGHEISNEEIIHIHRVRNCFSTPLKFFYF